MHIELTQQVNAPVDRVFAAWTDFKNAPRMIGAIEKVELLTDGPAAVGTRFAETRRMFGKEATETLEVTAIDPPNAYTLQADSCGCRYVCTISFTPNDAGTRVTLNVDTKTLTLFAKLMSPLGLLMAGSMKKMMRQDLADGAAYCEARAVEPVD